MNQENDYLTSEKTMKGMAIVLVMLMGWLFVLMAEASKDSRDRQAMIKERSAVNSTKIHAIDRRVVIIEKQVRK